jgi:chromate reductase
LNTSQASNIGSRFWSAACAGSINRKLAHAFIELAPAELKLSIVEIGDLPLYNQDLDETPPRSGSVSARRSRKPAPCFS